MTTRQRRRAPLRPYPRLLITISLIVMVGGAQAAPGWLDRLKGALGGAPEATDSLGTDEIGNGLKEALRVGTETVVAQLGQPDGFNLDPAVHIPLPGQLDKARDLLARIGMDASLTDLETRLNRAAEIAAPKAKALFLDAISNMTLDDVMGIYNGPDDAATQYFRSRMSAPLAAEMQPVVDESLADAGAVQAFDDVMARYRDIPFAPQVDANLTDYVVDKGIDGIFFYLAREEAAIRENPAKRTTDLLKRVFGS
ncbi:MAG: DUF4197 domain-containing protein [Pseudomonadales bacterium]